MTDVRVGTVVALWRYPVKSMAGEPLQTAELGWHGLAGDRRWGFVREGMIANGFPYLTIRERSSLAQCVSRFAEPDRPERSPVRVTTPEGGDFDVADPALRQALGGGVRPLKLDRGVFDSAPLSLITTQSVAGLGAAVGAPVDARRFRPNVIVEALEPAAWQEDGWVGSTLRIGASEVRVDRRDERCVVVNVDPETAHRDPAILRAIARERQACLGVYGTAVVPGPVAVGDEVVVVGPLRAR
jgi:uncharacterized protein YcbX